MFYFTISIIFHFLEVCSLLYFNILNIFHFIEVYKAFYFKKMNVFCLLRRAFKVVRLTTAVSNLARKEMPNERQATKSP